jgi:FkbM family methyltransferase
MMLSQDWEQAERALVERLLPSVEAFLDVGANHGFYTCMAASRGVDTAAVEPERGNLHFLYSNVRRNGFSNVEVYPVAVAAAPGVMSLYGDGDMASLVPHWAGVSDRFRQDVAVSTIDLLFGCRLKDRPLLIKMDVEGAELDVLRGSQELLSQSARRHWLIETFPFRVEDEARAANANFPLLFECMFDHGYGCERVDDRSPVQSADVAAIAKRSLSGERMSHNYYFDRGS